MSFILDSLWELINFDVKQDEMSLMAALECQSFVFKRTSGISQCFS